MTLRVGVVGAGVVARVIHLPGYAAARSAEVVAIASRSSTKAEALATEFGVEQIVADAADLIKSDEVDAVSICTPPSLHRHMVELAVEHDKHVLVEKPIATSLAELEAIQKVAKTTDKTVEVVRNERFMSFNLAAKRLLQESEIGEVITVTQSITTMGPGDWSPSAAWFRQPTISGGGALIDLAVHKVDVAVWMTGRPVEDVAAPVLGRTSGPVEETGVVNAILQGDVIASVFASWQGPADESTLTLLGSRGLIDGISSRGRLTVCVDGTERVVETTAPWTPGDRSGIAMVEAFVEDCIAGRRPVVLDPSWDSGTRVVLESYELMKESRR